LAVVGGRYISAKIPVKRGMSMAVALNYPKLTFTSHMGWCNFIPCLQCAVFLRGLCRMGEC